MSQPLLAQAMLALLVFGAAGLSFLALAPMFANRTDLRQRLGLAGAADARAPQSLRGGSGRSVWARLVEAVEARGVSLADAKAGPLRERLLQAGFAQSHAPRLFMLIRVVLTLGLPLAVGGPLVAAGSVSPFNLYLYITGLAVLGLYAPGILLDGRIKRRRTEILNGFPDTLDLMLICVEAGLGIDACFNRVGAEIRQSHPLLAEQFALVSLELRAGRSREDALRGLARRTALPEIGSFVTLIIQADKLGSSIAQALKVYAIEMREGRRMRAEEKAHRLPVLISIPLVVFMLPTMIGVLMLPGIIAIQRDMLPTMSESGAVSALPLCAAVLALGCMAAAAVEDVRRFEIPDGLSVATAVLFLCFAPEGLADSRLLPHVGVALAVFLAGAGLFAAGWMGGGDVKLLAAAALWAGPDHLAALLIGMALGGGLLALTLLLGRRLARGSLWPALRTGGPVPYAVAILGGFAWTVARLL